MRGASAAGIASRGAFIVRITLFVPTFPKLSETFIVAKFIGLLDQGHDVNIVCLESNTDDWEAFPSLNQRVGVRDRVLAIGSCAISVTGAMKCLSTFARLLQRTGLVLPVRYLFSKAKCNTTVALSSLGVEMALAARAPDVIHFEFGGVAPPYLGVRAISNAAVVVSFRGYDINYVGLEDPAHYVQVWQCAAGIHTLGADLWSRTVRRGCPEDIPHTFIPPAIDTMFFSRFMAYEPVIAGTAHRPIRIVSVGRLGWKKGYEYALASVRALLDRGLSVEYRIIGAGDYLEPLAFCRRQLGLEQHVEFVGAANRTIVRSELERADLFLHPAVSEGFCNAVVEAQSMQLPVVCTDADGLPENVSDGVTGIVVPRRDEHQMATAIEQLAANGERRLAMGKAGRHRAVLLYRIDQQIAAFEKFYNRVVERDGLGSSYSSQ